MFFFLVLFAVSSHDNISCCSVGSEKLMVIVKFSSLNIFYCHSGIKFNNFDSFL